MRRRTGCLGERGKVRPRTDDRGDCGAGYRGAHVGVRRGLCWLVAVLPVGFLLALALAQPAAAFTVDLPSTFLNFPWGGGKEHERLVNDAARLALRDKTRWNFDIGLERGAENIDITHQWDDESHFDNASTKTRVSGVSGTFEGWTNMRKAFSTVRERLTEAERRVKGAPANVLLDPSFSDFQRIASGVAGHLKDLALSRACLRQSECPTTLLLARAAKAKARAVLLRANPLPDPHNATSRRSIFHWPPCRCVSRAYDALQTGVGFLQKQSRESIASAAADVRWALGSHRGVSLTWLLGKDYPPVYQLSRDLQKIDAYVALQNLGHALHSSQDFFAHSNYIELMTDVLVTKRTIGRIPENRRDVPVPRTFDEFSEQGLRSIMGPERYARLETGAVRTIWMGEGDYCLGSRVFSIFNPAVPISFKGFRFAYAPFGKNQRPPRGFTYCHYQTLAAMGLNKDEPGTKEEALKNFDVARRAALKISVVVLKEFLSKTYPSELRTPPPPQITSAPTGATTSTSAVIEFGPSPGTDEPLRFRCHLDTQPGQSCASPFTVASLESGHHRVYVVGVDAAGQESYASTEWTVDTQGPVVVFRQQPGSVTPLPTARFEFVLSDSLSGPASSTCSLDGAPPTPCSSPFTTPALANGPHTLTVQGTDALGNLGPPNTASWTVDTTVSDTIIVSGPPPSFSGSGDVTLEFTSGVPSDTYECQLTTATKTLQDWAPCTSPKTYTGADYPINTTITFRVRSVSVGGSRDPTPAEWSWMRRVIN